MSGSWGKRLQLSIFGESHGPAIGITIGGLAAGIELDWDFIQGQMDKRRPGKNAWSTPRKEKDQVEVISGLYDNRTTGAPLTALIYNQDQRSQDYDKMASLARPSHADYPAHIRYQGFNDPRGGGHFSGRLTAPLVFAGALAQQILAQSGVEVKAFVRRIGSVEVPGPDRVSLRAADLKESRALDCPSYRQEDWPLLKEEILAAKRDKDSVGGTVECLVAGLEAGLGDPFFHSLESVLASLIFSVPAVKGLSFGSGFDLASMRGSKANDLWQVKDGQVTTQTNHNGGIVGGISTGMPLSFTAAIKPTPTIGLAQKTIHMEKKEAASLAAKGRHDPCIVVRVLPVIEGVTALALLESRGLISWN